MANTGGPFGFESWHPVSAGDVFSMVYVGDGAVPDQTHGLGVADATEIAADAIWRGQCPAPMVLPATGNPYLRIRSRADAVTGVLKVNPKWKSVAAGEDPSTGALNAEGTTTITWSTNDDDEILETFVQLNADTVVAGETIFMDFVIEDTGTTLAVDSVHVLDVIWKT